MSIYIQDREVYDITLVILAIGLFIISISTIRWFFMYPDMSQLFLGWISGASFILFGYMYQWMQGVNKDINQLRSQNLAILEWRKKNGEFTK